MVVTGGGCSEMLMACAVQAEAAKTPGKEAVAMEGFARALQMLPTIIADNAGYDSAQLVSELRAAHAQGNHTQGLGQCYTSGSQVIHVTSDTVAWWLE